MKGLKIEAKTAIGRKDVSGKIKVLGGEKEELLSFRSLTSELGGKILVCLGEVSKTVLEKARALGVLGLVCCALADEEQLRLKKELKTFWSPSPFVLLIVGEEIEKFLSEIEGRKGTIEIKKKRLVIEE